MSLYTTSDPRALAHFAKRTEALAIATRSPLPDSNDFFEQVLKHPVKVAGVVKHRAVAEDIQDILSEVLPDNIQQHAFYGSWVQDMAEISQIFAEAQHTDAVSFWLGTQRGCRLYHVDNVPFRLLVTYAGQGTEWVPEEATNRDALQAGARGDDLITDPSAVRFMNPWDIAIFRGGPTGLLHRTPDSALNAPSLLLRLDHPSFWENVLKPAA